MNFMVNTASMIVPIACVLIILHLISFPILRLVRVNPKEKKLRALGMAFLPFNESLLVQFEKLFLEGYMPLSFAAMLHIRGILINGF